MRPFLYLGPTAITDGLLLRLGPNIITDGAFITLGSKCYYRCDLYYTWVRLLHLCFLQGQENKRAITYNTSARQSNLYFSAGHMIGCTIMHCDIGVPVFSKSMCYFISHETVQMTEMPHSAGHPRLLCCGTDTQGKAAHPDDDVGIFVDFVHNKIFLRHPRQDWFT